MQRVIGFNFEKIDAERKSPPKGKVQVRSNIDIKSITSEKLDIAKDQTALKFEFEFSVDYKPNIATILLRGYVLALFDKDKAKDVQKKSKNKKILDEIRVPLFNFILTKCNLKAIHFEEEFGLPLHIPLPRIKPGQAPESAGYTG